LVNVCATGAAKAYCAIDNNGNAVAERFRAFEAADAPL
jgi:hypothetical protein